MNAYKEILTLEQLDLVAQRDFRNLFGLSNASKHWIVSSFPEGSSGWSLWDPSEASRLEVLKTLKNSDFAERSTVLLPLDEARYIVDIVSEIRSQLVGQLVELEQEKVFYGVKVGYETLTDPRAEAWPEFISDTVTDAYKYGPFVIVTDIRNFYGSITADKMWAALNGRVTCSILHRLHSYMNSLQERGFKGLPLGYSSFDLLARIFLQCILERVLGSGIKIKFYVDDIRIIVNCASKVQSVVSLMSDTLGEWDLRLSPEKTTHVNVEENVQPVDGIINWKWSRVLKGYKADEYELYAGYLKDDDELSYLGTVLLPKNFDLERAHGDWHHELPYCSERAFRAVLAKEQEFKMPMSQANVARFMRSAQKNMLDLHRLYGTERVGESRALTYNVMYSGSWSDTGRADGIRILANRRDSVEQKEVNVALNRFDSATPGAYRNSLISLGAQTSDASEVDRLLDYANRRQTSIPLIELLANVNDISDCVRLRSKGGPHRNNPIISHILEQG